MTHEEPTDWRRIAGPGALVAAVLLWFGPVLLGGEVLALRDTLLDFLPWREFAAQALADGGLPLWSHESRMGQPFLAHPQSAVFYPPHLLWLVLPSTAALAVTQVGHLLLMALGAFALARRLGLSVAPAVVAAAGLTFSTYTIAQMEFLPAYETVCWGPLTLLLADRVVRAATDEGGRLRSVARPVALLAVAWGVQALAGHPQALFQNVALVTIYCAVRAGASRQLARSFGALLAAGVLGMLLAAPQILVSLDHLSESTRSGAFDSGAAEASVHPRYLLSLLAPFAFGRPGYDGSWWNEHVFEYWAAICHVGLVPVLLAPLALFRPASRAPWAFLAIVVVGLVLAMGTHAGVYPLLAEHIPPFDRFRWPGKWLHLVALGLPFLGAFGLQQLVDADRRSTVHAALTIAGVLVALVGAAYVAGDAAFYAGLLDASFADLERLGAVRGEHLRTLLSLLVVAAAMALFLRPKWRPIAAVVLAGVALVDAGTRSRSLHGTLPAVVTEHVPDWIAGLDDAPRARVHTTHSLGQLWLYGQSAAPWQVFARDASLGETLLPLGVDRTWGFGQLIPRRQWDAWKRLQDPSIPSAQRERLSDLLNVGVVLHGAPLDERAIRSGAIPNLRVLRRTTHLPRAFVASSAVISDAPWDVVLRPDFDPRRTVVLSDVETTAIADAAPSRAEVDVAYDGNEIVVDVRTDQPGHLVLLEPYDPRWEVTVGGNALEARRANGLFMSLVVPQGAFTFTFRYREPMLPVGAAAAGLGLLLTLLLALRGAGAQVRPASSPEGASAASASIAPTTR